MVIIKQKFKENELVPSLPSCLLCNRAIRESYQISQHNLLFTLKLLSFLAGLSWSESLTCIFPLLQHIYCICNFQAHHRSSVLKGLLLLLFSYAFYSTITSLPLGQIFSIRSTIFTTPFYIPLGMKTEHNLVSTYSVQSLVTKTFFSC